MTQSSTKANTIAQCSDGCKLDPASKCSIWQLQNQRYKSCYVLQRNYCVSCELLRRLGRVSCRSLERDGCAPPDDILQLANWNRVPWTAWPKGTTSTRSALRRWSTERDAIPTPWTCVSTANVWWVYRALLGRDSPHIKDHYGWRTANWLIKTRHPTSVDRFGLELVARYIYRRPLRLEAILPPPECGHMFVFTRMHAHNLRTQTTRRVRSHVCVCLRVKVVYINQTIPIARFSMVMIIVK